MPTGWPQIQPRVCGDYKILTKRKKTFLDTTPRVRGLRTAWTQFLESARYNPACAGTTPSGSVRKSPGAIQPRVCGDYVSTMRVVRGLVDTTPRVRGLQCSKYSAKLTNRYNPACAGTTSDRLHRGAVKPIQPRVCGDYLYLESTSFCIPDTTPRVRGLPCRRGCCIARGRYNPACAGTTAPSTMVSMPASIQPRVCGDYFHEPSPSACRLDTTPRVRGLRRRTL